MEVNERFFEDLAKSMEGIEKNSEQYPLVIQDLADTIKANNTFLSKLVSKQDEEDEKVKEEDEEAEMLKRIKNAFAKMNKGEIDSLLKQIKEEPAKPRKAGEEMEAIQASLKKQEEEEEDEEEEKKSFKKQDDEKEDEEDEEKKSTDVAKLIKASMEGLKKDLVKEFGWVKAGANPIGKLSHISDETPIMKSATSSEEAYEMNVDSLKKLGFREISAIEEKVRRGEIKLT